MSDSVFIILLLLTFVYNVFTKFVGICEINVYTASTYYILLYIYLHVSNVYGVGMETYYTLHLDGIMHKGANPHYKKR